MIWTFDTILAIIFILLLTVLLYHYRKRIEFQKILFPLLYVVMMRTKLGLRFMDNLAKRWPRLLRGLGYAGVVVGYLGMAAIAILLLVNTYHICGLFIQRIIEGAYGSAIPAWLQGLYSALQGNINQQAAQGAGLVLPIPIKGVFFVPFSHWIISLFVIAVIHEASHGIVARAHKIKVHSSGWAFLCVFLPIIPAAFVEPEEKILSKRPKKQQLSVFAAGPWSNILSAIIFFIIIIGLFAPLEPRYVDPAGITATGLAKEGPLALAGGERGIIITSVDGEETLAVQELLATLQEREPGDQVTIGTTEQAYDVTLGDNKGEPYLGVTQLQQAKEAKNGAFSGMLFMWFHQLFVWLFILSLGIGLFNLVPVGPIDGGRMFKVATDKFFKKKSDKVFKWVSIIFLALILVNVFAGFVL